MSGACRVSGEEEPAPSSGFEERTVGVTITIHTWTEVRISCNGYLKSQGYGRETLTHSERILSPIPGKEVFLSILVIPLDVVDLYSVNSRQVVEDHVKEPGLSGAVGVDKRGQSLGILEPSVGRNEHFGLGSLFRI